jgi:hypothetical protein
MRQLVPHRNNIGSVGRSCKTFLHPIRHIPVDWLDGKKLGESHTASKSIAISTRTKPYTNRRQVRERRAAARKDTRHALGA